MQIAHISCHLLQQRENHSSRRTCSMHVAILTGNYIRTICIIAIDLIAPNPHGMAATQQLTHCTTASACRVSEH